MIPHQFTRGDMTPGGIERYRQQSATAPYVHIRKRCACGSVVTAKQLDQYLACPTCVKVARITQLAANRICGDSNQKSVATPPDSQSGGMAITNTERTS